MSSSQGKQRRPTLEWSPEATATCSEPRGFQLDVCSGSRGCPNRAQRSDSLVAKLETLLQQAELLPFLMERLGREPRPHHRFQVAVADCPNGCSRPQIKDIGIIAAQMPRVTEAPCLGCRECEAVCAETAVWFSASVEGPVVQASACLGCGQCVAICPTEALHPGPSGYRVALGGQLGRHPKLARELPGLYSEDQTVTIVEACLDYYKRTCQDGARFSKLLSSRAFEELTRGLSRLPGFPGSGPPRRQPSTDPPDAKRGHRPGRTGR